MYCKRPDRSRLTTVPGTQHRLQLPRGCFNPALAEAPNGYVLVYRRDECSFCCCMVSNDLMVVPDSHFLLQLGEAPVADPRLLWMPDGRLLLIYSSLDTSDGVTCEAMRGAVITNERNKLVVRPRQFLLSPRDSRARQKNWMPFCCNQQVYLIASTRPLVVFCLNPETLSTEQVSTADWTGNWLYPEEFLRGNTNAVELDDGRFLTTFHTAVRIGTERLLYYDTGAVVFARTQDDSGAGFAVTRCSNRTILPAESAVEKHFRKEGLIQTCFPCGMVREGERLLISYGDNDTACKILETTITALLETTTEVYDF